MQHFGRFDQELVAAIYTRIGLPRSSEDGVGRYLGRIAYQQNHTRLQIMDILLAYWDTSGNATIAMDTLQERFGRPAGPAGAFKKPPKTGNFYSPSNFDPDAFLARFTRPAN